MRASTFTPSADVAVAQVMLAHRRQAVRMAGRTLGFGQPSEVRKLAVQ